MEAKKKGHMEVVSTHSSVVVLSLCRDVWFGGQNQTKADCGRLQSLNAYSHNQYISKSYFYSNDSSYKSSACLYVLGVFKKHL